ncbi:PREDICTED: acyl-CoA-binding domain-containing protein 5-like [Amphimedon queenslandica]|uniref:Protein kinase domain-containing protein n=2 Tax=Amphimedon queenslandica TaxID=400682 RepID=A0AAN0J6L8_AMPQE|nr:PREDICTED: acyl-CoA-binding domain-containing protein 5-like [Amphimedon queenslandica]|eukprot:XP_019852402.1 PREDICTED: acyl-CoA-binding domain-containing protein 5-like [Amphimedon queenslandica]
MAWLFGSKNQLNKRAHHRTVSLYVWAGAQDGLPEAHDSEEKRKVTSNIQHFTPSAGQWITKSTIGTPPLGAKQYCCTTINDQLYYFGGWCGHDDCYHNSITQLDTVSLQWRELEPTDATRPVMRRGSGGMISFEHDGVHHLLMIGGLGSKPAVQLSHYKYIQLPSGRWRTNEHSMYNLSSGKWNNPSIIGQCMLPTAAFIIEKINNTRAVLFGGRETDDDVQNTNANNIYILEISISTVFWQCIKKPKAINQWPVGRFYHAGAIIITGSDYPMLVISGGRDKNNDTLDDCWILNVTQHSWIKLVVPHSVSKRWAHSLSVFIMSPHCVWMITAGGFVDKIRTFVTSPNVVTLTELVSSKREWTVCDTLDTSGMNNEEYKKKYQQQLQLGRKIWLEEYQKPRKGDTANIEQTIQGLMKSLEEKEREAQVYHQKLEQKEKEESEKEQQYCHRLQEKDREHQVALQELHEALQQKDIVILKKDRELQGKDKELQEKDRELLQSQEAVRRYQQKALTDDHWVINKDEVTLTKEELGRGSYAVVIVGIFRGLRVAVKSLHTIIISDYNLALFSREMNIASRVRHPNLVQFIGATKLGNPLVLTELMSTSLNQELRRNRLTNQQILSIAQDVALGLNYLHLFKPQPIIHRDVSSPNVLLKPCTGPAGYEAKVADYGTAKVVQAENTGTVMPGNIAYAAPEAPIPDQHSPAMDVYSYSVLLMEMNLCSRPEMTTMEREVQSNSVSWSDMKSLIQRGLNANPRARPTMAQVIESLKRMKT